MPQTLLRPPSVRTATALERQLRREGFRKGFPLHLSRSARQADVAAYDHRVQCHGCRSRLLMFPYHRTAERGGGYRILLACLACGAGLIA